MRSALLLFSGTVFATTANYHVTGTIHDSDGLPIPGAVVRLLGPRGEKAAEETASDGSFRLSSATPGDYILEVSRAGFETVRRPIRIEKSVTSIRLALQIAGRREVIEVAATGPQTVTLDPAENRDTVQVTRDLLRDLPIMGTDVLGTARQFADPASMGSGNDRIVVDGVETRNVRLQRSEIEEIRINRNPYSAQYSRPGGGRIEVLTRQASPQYHGELSFSVREHRLDARNALAAGKPEQQQRDYTIALNGPLGRWRKNTFSLSLEREEDDQQAVILARTPEGLVQQNAAQPRRETEFSARLNRYHSDRHLLSWRYESDRESESGAGAGGFVLPEAGYDSVARGHGVDFRHRWVIRPTLLAELALHLERERDRTASVNPGIRRIEVQDAFTSGGAQRDESALQSEIELSYVISWTAGRHLVRGGFLIPEVEWNSLEDRGNFDGTYVFSSLEEFAAGRPFSFSANHGNGRLSYQNREVAAFLQNDMRFGSDVIVGIGLRYDRQRHLADHNNLAPRLSLAWGFGEKRKTVLRTGAGIFYDQLSQESIADALRFDGLRLRQILIPNPAFPSPEIGGSAATVPPGIVRFAPRLRMPYMTQVSTGLERELPGSMALAVTYTWLRGLKRFRSLDRNAPQPPGFERLDPARGLVREIESSAGLTSHAMNISLQGRIAKIFRGTVQYVLAHSKNDVDGDSELPPDSADLRNEWARPSSDVRHRLRLLGSWDLPGGLTLGTIFRAESGPPYEWTTGLDFNRDGRAAERPAGVRRNALEAPGSATLDVRLSRRFHTRRGDEDSPEITLSADAFNALNRVNYIRLVGNQSSPFFGLPVAAAPARRLQIGLALEF